MLKFTYILVFSFCLYSGLQAQNKNYVYQDSTLASPGNKAETKAEANQLSPGDHSEQTIDTVLYNNQIKISPDSVQSWKNGKSFEYAKYLDSLLKARQNKEKSKVDDSGASGPSWLDSFFSSPFTKIFFWILAGIFILFILYKLFLTDGVFSRVPKAEKNAAPAVAEETITGESDFDAMIGMAIRSGNYRLAVRYQYLKTLHRLADKNFILLAADKTNYQYVREIRDQQYRNDFAGLTLSYEYAWYGEFAIEENIYRKIERNFSDFNQKT